LNLLNRDFTAGAPNRKWLTDITWFQIPAGKVYLSPMIDCFDGMVVSWSIGTRPDAELVNTMLDAAIDTVIAGSQPDRRSFNCVSLGSPEHPSLGLAGSTKASWL